MRIGLVMICLALGVCGCVSQRERPFGMEYLRAAASSDYNPTQGADFWHPGKNMRVLQVVNGGVLAIADVGMWDRKVRNADAGKERLVVFLEMNEPYVDDEPVRKGVYKFTGTYQYVTVSGTQRTVRRFEKVERNR